MTHSTLSRSATRLPIRARTLPPLSPLILSALLILFISLISTPSPCEAKIPVPRPDSYSFYYNDTLVFVDSKRQMLRLDYEERIYLSRDNGESWFLIDLGEATDSDSHSKEYTITKQEDGNEEDATPAPIATHCSKYFKPLFAPNRFNWEEPNEFPDIPYSVSALSHDILKLFYAADQDPDNWGLDFDRNCFVLRDFYRLTWLCVDRDGGAPRMYGPVKEEMRPFQAWKENLPESELEKIFRLPAVCHQGASNNAKTEL